MYSYYSLHFIQGTVSALCVSDGSEIKSPVNLSSNSEVL